MFVKQLMELGSGTNSIATQDAYGIVGEFDMDAICGVLQFSLPYYIPYPDSTEMQGPDPASGLNTNELKKFDTVKLYYLETDTDGEIIQGTNVFEVINAFGEIEEITENNYTINEVEMVKVFDGFIDEIKHRKAKMNIPYNFVALGTVGISNYRNLEYEHKSGTAGELIQTIFQISGAQIGPFNVSPVLFDYVPAWRIRFIDTNVANRVLIVDGGTDLKEVIVALRKKYALIFHQSGDGFFNVITPFYLLQAESDELLSVNAWQFDINNGTLFDIDYGDVTKQKNAVVMLGSPGSLGIAVDPIAVQNNGGKINYVIEENRRLRGDEECQRVARDKLLELSRNFTLVIKTKFSPELMIGQPFTVIDNDKYDGTQVFIIKKYKFTIAKNDVSAMVHGYAHAADVAPEDILISNTGILDVDVLQIRDKELDITQWRNL